MLGFELITFLRRVAFIPNQYTSESFASWRWLKLKELGNFIRFVATLIIIFVVTKTQHIKRGETKHIPPTLSLMYIKPLNITEKKEKKWTAFEAFLSKSHLIRLWSSKTG